MLRWFKRRLKKPQPEASWVVSITPETIRVTDSAGTSASVSRAELSGIAIETNDSGPWGADVWWLLFGADDQVACMFPQGATGEQAALDALMSLPKFDYEQMIMAMRSTDNAIFPVWRRGE